MKGIETPNAPKVVGSYSQAVQAGDFLFCSGQIGINPKTNELEEGIESQTHQVLKNLQAVVAQAKANWEHITQVTIYLTSMDDYPTVNEIYTMYVSMKIKPARVTVAVAALPKNASIEISCTVYNKIA